MNRSGPCNRELIFFFALARTSLCILVMRHGSHHLGCSLGMATFLFSLLAYNTKSVLLLTLQLLSGCTAFSDACYFSLGILGPSHRHTGAGFFNFVHTAWMYFLCWRQGHHYIHRHVDVSPIPHEVWRNAWHLFQPSHRLLRV